MFPSCAVYDKQSIFSQSACIYLINLPVLIFDVIMHFWRVSYFYSRYILESGMTIVDIDGFFWRAEIYPQKQNRFISGRKSKETFGRRGNIKRNIRRESILYQKKSIVNQKKNLERKSCKKKY